MTSNGFDHNRLILVVNDDGIDSEGLVELVDKLSDLGNVLVAAPLHPHSGAGRIMPNSKWNLGSGAIHERQLDVRYKDRVKAYAVDSTPVGCVIHALNELLEVGVRPDICFSGINWGGNVGLHIYASGTVGAALEAAAAGITSVAVSQNLPPREVRPTTTEGKRELMSVAAEIAKRFAETLLVSPPEKTMCLNVNVPVDATLDTPVNLADQTLDTWIDWNIPGGRERSEPLTVTPSWQQDAQYPVGGDLHELITAKNVTVTPLTVGMQDHHANPVVMQRIIGRNL